MLSRRVARQLAGWAAIAGLAAPAVTLALPGLREQTYGDIEFISGGVGEREREALVNISNAYNVFLTMALDTGAYLAEVHVRVRDENGQLVLETTTRGPYLLADLPAGRYEVEGRSQEHVVRRTITATQGQVAHALFSFPVEP